MPYSCNKSEQSSEFLCVIHYKHRLLTPKQQYTAETNITAVRIMRQVTKKPIISLELQTTKRLDVSTAIFITLQFTVSVASDKLTLSLYSLQPCAKYCGSKHLTRGCDGN